MLEDIYKESIVRIIISRIWGCLGAAWAGVITQW